MTNPRTNPWPHRRLHNATRGFALFVGCFGLANLSLGLVHANWNANDFWTGLPSFVIAPACLALALWAVAPRLRFVRGAATLSALALSTGCVLDAIGVARAEHAGGVVLGGALSLSSALAVLLLCTTLSAYRTRTGEKPRARRRVFQLAEVALFAGLSAAALPLALTATLGRSDYRGPADAIVVLGARAYADGRLSHALEDRVRTAAELYREGHAPLIWMSGGPGDGAVHEVEAMRDAAVALGVPADRVQLDFEGWNTARTAHNIAPRLPADGRVIAVSHGFHLARVRLAFAREGRTVVTVPADSPTRPLAARARLTLRDAAGFWAYWLGYGTS